MRRPIVPKRGMGGKFSSVQGEHEGLVKDIDGSTWGGVPNINPSRLKSRVLAMPNFHFGAFCPSRTAGERFEIALLAAQRDQNMVFHSTRCNIKSGATRAWLVNRALESLDAGLRTIRFSPCSIGKVAATPLQRFANCWARCN